MNERDFDILISSLKDISGATLNTLNEILLELRWARTDKEAAEQASICGGGHSAGIKVEGGI